jgi:hypothetical protein
MTRGTGDVTSTANCVALGQILRSEGGPYGVSRHRNAVEPEPGRQRGKLTINGGTHRLAERHVVMDRVHVETTGGRVCCCVDLADEALVMEDGQHEISPPALILRFVKLEREVEVEQFQHSDAVMHESIEG